MKRRIRQTSDKVSTLASILMTCLRGAPSRTVAEASWVERKQKRSVRFYVKDVRELAASCLNQDQTKGKRRR